MSAFGSCQLCPASPSSEELHFCPLSTLSPRGFPVCPHPPPPNAHEGAWGWPICDRAEVSSGLGKGAAQSGTGGAGHTVGLLSNWKPGVQQKPVNCLSGTKPAMTARPRQAGAFRCSDSLSHRRRAWPSNCRPQWNRWPWSRFRANFKELPNFTVSDLQSQTSACLWIYITCSQEFLSSFSLPFRPPLSLIHTHAG